MIGFWSPAKPKLRNYNGAQRIGLTGLAGDI